MEICSFSCMQRLMRYSVSKRFLSCIILFSLLGTAFFTFLPNLTANGRCHAGVSASKEVKSDQPAA